MNIGRVCGSAVATVKHPDLTGSKMLIVQPVTPGGEAVGYPYVAIDLVGAGEGEIVLVATGEPARRAARVEGPIDAAVVGIVDDLNSGGSRTYGKD